MPFATGPPSLIQPVPSPSPATTTDDVVLPYSALPRRFSFLRTSSAQPHRRRLQLDVVLSTSPPTPCCPRRPTFSNPSSFCPAPSQKPSLLCQDLNRRTHPSSLSDPKSLVAAHPVPIDPHHSRSSSFLNQPRSLPHHPLSSAAPSSLADQFVAPSSDAIFHAPP